jgi:hypothetical protein
MHGKTRGGGPVNEQFTNSHALSGELASREAPELVISDDGQNCGVDRKAREAGSHDPAAAAEREVGTLEQLFGLAEPGNDIPAQHEVDIGIANDEDPGCHRFNPENIVATDRQGGHKATRRAGSTGRIAIGGSVNGE